MAEAGNVYLTSFALSTKATGAKDGNSSAKEAEKTTFSGPAKVTQKEAEVRVIESPKVASTNAMMGEFNHKSNAKLGEICQMPICAEIGDIKGNVAE